MTKLNIGLIGLERIGMMHLKNILNLSEFYKLTAIADPFKDNLDEIAKQYSIPTFSKSYKDVLNDKNVNVVLIASSTDTHAEIISAAAEAGKDILCEKPIDTDISRIKKVLALVSEKNVILQIGFNRRFDHNFNKINELVTEGIIGTPQIIKISSRDPAPPSIDYIKVSGGIFSDMMIHDLDMIRFLSNTEVTEVYAQGSVLVDPEIGKVGDIDTAMVTCKFANGALGVIDNSRQAVYGYDQRAEVFGSKGQVFSNNDKLTNIQVDLKDGSRLDKIPNFFIERYKDAYLNELKAFYKSVTEHATPVSSGIDGLRSIQLAKACLESYKSHKPVKIEY
ncbi:inositol 2-dehydrogenase [Companilactobacillus farciminis]|uniref:inositol 2-dehydrogenase n=1 Tax=Companilactobacillus farciminis TaxID=1612 RepID=UPI0019168956|nr:inositol 2-dehydrogenase [Companilactobacillus farciminis]